jgi:putative transposase
MEHSRRTAHTRLEIKYHLVWITKYRSKILKGHVSSNHVHLFVSCPPHMSVSYLLRKLCSGRHLWAPGVS